MSLYEAAKDAVKLAQKADNIELVQRVLEIQKEALDMQETIQNKNDVIEKLKLQKQELQALLAAKDEYILDKGVRWKTEDSQMDQPYCPVCYAKGKIMPLQKTWDGESKDRTRWHCPEKSCNASFNPWDFKEESNISSGGNKDMMYGLGVKF